MHVISNDGTSIAYSVAGTGPALILIDGALCYRGAGPLGALVAPLAPHFTVYTYDRRGRGESTDTAPYAVDREVDDLGALIAAAGGSASLFGVSSGAVLALWAARGGLPIDRLALFEPPIGASSLPSELAELVAAGRRGAAVQHFQTAIGLPAEMVAAMPDAPFWPALEAIAHTLVYDTTISASLPTGVRQPALVIDSIGSPHALRAMAKSVCQSLPNGRQHSLEGTFHDVPADQLAPVLLDFLRER